MKEEEENKAVGLRVTRPLSKRKKNLLPGEGVPTEQSLPFFVFFSLLFFGVLALNPPRFMPQAREVGSTTCLISNIYHVAVPINAQIGAYFIIHGIGLNFFFF